MRTGTEVNEILRVQKGRVARKNPNLNNGKINILIICMAGILFFALSYLYLQTLNIQTSMDLAKTQKFYLELQNQQFRLVQEVAELKDPSRIQKLAMGIGMIPPNEDRLAQVYMAPWQNRGKAAVAIKPVAEKSAMTERASLWSKIFSFSARAEANASVLR
jgi:cell division protein FtsL